MPPAKPPRGSAAAVSSTLEELFTKHLPSLWAQSTTGAPKLFQSGIELISVTVKAGPVDVSLTVAGKDAPRTLQFPTLSGEAS